MFHSHTQLSIRQSSEEDRGIIVGHFSKSLASGAFHTEIPPKSEKKSYPRGGVSNFWRLNADETRSGYFHPEHAEE